jgi:hypothetical protein
MQLKHKLLTLNSTPQNLVTREDVHSLNTLSVQNIMTAGYAYLGNENVSTSNYGHKLYPGQSFTIELAWSDNLYAIGDSGVQVAILEIDRR